jgi:hypothetical protein
VAGAADSPADEDITAHPPGTGPAPGGDEPARIDAESSADAPAKMDPAATVWIVRGVSRHHLHDCVLISVVGEEDVDTMTLAEAEAADCTPCKACHLD